MRFFRDLILAGLVVCVVVLAFEGVLRLARVHYEASLYESEDERGYALRPNSEGWSTVEADVYIRTNSDGMRDRERPIARPADTLRVAVIGSSEADARQVPLDRTFEAVMNRELSQEIEPKGWRADVLNFGVPGYTFSQEYLTLRDHVWKYQPQVVILLFSAYPVLKTTRAFYPSELKGAPVYVLEQDGELVPDAITRNTLPMDVRRQRWKNRMSDWMNSSDVLSLLNMARVKLPELVDRVRPTLSKPEPSSTVLDARRYNPDQPETQESWAITEALLRNMKRDCEQHGSEFWIVVSDLEMQVHPSLAERAAFQRRLHLSSLDLVDGRLEQFGAAEGVPVLALARPLGEYAASHGVFLHGPPGSRSNIGHWNEQGNELTGHAIARDLIAHSQLVREIDAHQ